MGTCTAPRSPLSRLAHVIPWPRVVGAVLPRSYARRYRGSLALSPVPAWSVMPYRTRRASEAVTAAATRPRSAPRRPRPAGRRAVTSFRHAPCLAAPGVPLRCVVGGATAPGRGRPSAVVLPRASVLPSRSGLVMPRARGRARGTPSPPLPDSAPGWTPGLARCGAGPRRLCSPRWGGAALPPSAGGRSAGVRAERPDARRRSGRPLACLAGGSAKAGPASASCAFPCSPSSARCCLAFGSLPPRRRRGSRSPSAMSEVEWPPGGSRSRRLRIGSESGRARREEERRGIGARAYARTLAKSAMPTRHPVDPGLSAPKRKARSQKPDAVLVNCGCIRLFTASFSCSGRKPSASIVPPWPWPCRPTPARRPACRSRCAAA